MALAPLRIPAPRTNAGKLTLFRIVAHLDLDLSGVPSRPSRREYELCGDILAHSFESEWKGSWADLPSCELESARFSVPAAPSDDHQRRALTRRRSESLVAKSIQRSTSSLIRAKLSSCSRTLASSSCLTKRELCLPFLV